MQVHTDQQMPDGPLPVHTNPGSGDPFAIITLADTVIHLEGPDDCDRLMAALGTAKTMLALAVRQHGFELGAGPHGRHCRYCGLLKTNVIHAAPEARFADPEADEDPTIDPDWPGDPAPDPVAADVAAYRESAAAGYCAATHPRDGVACSIQGPHQRHSYVPFAARSGYGVPVTWTDADTLGHAIDNKLPVVETEAAR